MIALCPLPFTLLFCHERSNIRRTLRNSAAVGKKAGRRSLLARDLKTEELVVIKLLSFNSDFEWDDLKLFEREAETLKSLYHPQFRAI
jgi:hypothetical protein